MALFNSDESPKDGEWTLLFDEVPNALGYDINIILISPKAKIVSLTTKLCFDCRNNMVEYEVCAIGEQAVLDLEVKILKVYGDLTLVIH